MNDSNNPLAGLEEWEGFLKVRYPENQSSTAAVQETSPVKKKEAFRDYESDARASVRRSLGPKLI